MQLVGVRQARNSTIRVQEGGEWQVNRLAPYKKRSILLGGWEGKSSLLINFSYGQSEKMVKYGSDPGLWGRGSRILWLEYGRVIESKRQVGLNQRRGEVTSKQPVLLK